MICDFSAPIPDQVEAVVLFGSQSRGDADCVSDVDIAAFAHATSLESLINVKRHLCMGNTPDANFSVYSAFTAETMASDGSLFLLHLKCEGRVLYQRSFWIDNLLQCLQPYSRAKALRDLRTFDSVLGDIKSGLEEGEATSLFEASTLFSVLRSVGMIVSAASGKPCFSRWQPIWNLQALIGSHFPWKSVV